MIIIRLFLVLIIIPHLMAVIRYFKNEKITGKVIRVIDGDRITIRMPNKKCLNIRLAAIDCPEMKQNFGREAKEFIAKLCVGKQVWIEIEDRDRYLQWICFVMVGDINVNKELLKAGLAWHYKYFNKDKELADLERVARNKKIGLWSQPKPVAPWKFRRLYNQKQNQQ